MQRFITDERTGIRYELIGDYIKAAPPRSFAIMALMEE